MKRKILIVFTICFLSVSSCAKTTLQSSDQAENIKSVNEKTNVAENAGSANNAALNFQNSNNAEHSEIIETQAKQPKTIRDFFMLLPEKYFTLESCFPEKDKDCRKAKLDYLKTFAEIEDTENGYLKGGCDGAQSCMEMALFKRPDGSYLVGLATSAEMIEENFFLDYKNGKWTDVSAKIVPGFSKKNMYDLPRYGTTIEVFAKKIIEKGDDYEVSEKGEKLYDLEWKNGKFTIIK